MKKIIIISLLLLTSLSFSQSGAGKFLFYRKVKVLNNISGKSEITFSVTDTNNNEIYSIKKLESNKEEIPNLYLFNNGASVVTGILDGKIEIYDSLGILKNTVYPFRNYPFKYERSILIDISGNYCAAIASQQDMNELLVLILSSNGKVINTFNINKPYFNSLKFSEEMNLLAVSVYDWNRNKLKRNTVFYNLQGDKELIVHDSFGGAKFYPKLKLFLGFDKNSFFVADLQNKNLVIENRLSGNLLINDADLSGNKLYLAASQKPLLKNGKWFYNNLAMETINLVTGKQTGIPVKLKPFTTLKIIKRKSALYIKTGSSEVKIPVNSLGK